MADTTYTAVDFSELPSADNGKTLIYKDGQVCQSNEDLSSLIGKQTSGYATQEWVNNKLDSDYYNVDEVNECLDEKLFVSSFSAVSGTFLTAVDIPESATWNDVSNTVQTNSADWASHQDLSYLATKEELSAGLNEVKQYVDEGIQEIANGLNDLTDYVDTGFSNIEYAIDEKLDTTAFETVSGDFLTSADLDNYYTKSETSGKDEISTALNGKEDKIFVAEYNVTTYQELLDAYNVGKQIVCKYNPLPQFPDQTIFAYLTQYVPMGNTFCFAANNTANQFQMIECSQSYGWVVGNHAYQEQLYITGEDNTITAINSSAIKVDLTDYYTKSETSGKTELTNAFNNKMNLFQIGTDLILWQGKLGVNTDGYIGNSNYAFVEGKGTSALGAYTHAEGQCTVATNNNGHAEGYYTSATHQQAHTEGSYTLADGSNAHAEGTNTYAHGHDSHAEGGFTTANDFYAHSEGTYSIANATASHAEGYYTTAIGNYSHSEGYQTSAVGEYSHAEGYKTSANGNDAHSEGSNTYSVGGAHAEGNKTSAMTLYTHAEGENTVAASTAAHSEGSYTSANGKYSHAEGGRTVANGLESHSEGYYTSALADYSHAEGGKTLILSGATAAHTEGSATSAKNTYAHAEGVKSIANSIASHAEGSATSAMASYSHTEGIETYANGSFGSHAQGYRTSANGSYSFVGGCYTLANYSHETVLGKYNLLERTDSPLFVIGNGTSTTNRSDAFVVNLNGTASATKFETTQLAVGNITDIEATINSLAGVGGYAVVASTASITNPDTKTIYLVKDTTVTGNDQYKEYICTNTATPTFEMIGDTSIDLSNYYTRTETSGASEISTEFGKYLTTAQYQTDSATYITAIDPTVFQPVSGMTGYVPIATYNELYNSYTALSSWLASVSARWVVTPAN